jgi:hypothetical protein
MPDTLLGLDEMVPRMQIVVVSREAFEPEVRA